MKISGAVVEDVDVKDAEATGVEAAKTVTVVATGVVTARVEGTATISPTNQVWSGVKLGDEQGKLLRKPSALRPKHWFPGPTPLLTAFRTRGKPILPERLAVELK